jgi:hypothetical protein
MRPWPYGAGSLVAVMTFRFVAWEPSGDRFIRPLGPPRAQLFMREARSHAATVPGQGFKNTSGQGLPLMLPAMYVQPFGSPRAVRPPIP